MRDTGGRLACIPPVPVQCLRAPSTRLQCATDPSVIVAGHRSAFCLKLMRRALHLRTTVGICRTANLTMSRQGAARAT